MNPELELLVQEKIDTAEAAGVPIPVEEIKAFILQWEEDNLVEADPLEDTAVEEKLPEDEVVDFESIDSKAIYDLKKQLQGPTMVEVDEDGIETHVANNASNITVRDGLATSPLFPQLQASALYGGNDTYVSLPNGEMTIITPDRTGATSEETDKVVDELNAFYSDPKNAKKSRHAYWSLFEMNDNSANELNDVDGWNKAMAKAGYKVEEVTESTQQYVDESGTYREQYSEPRYKLTKNGFPQGGDMTRQELQKYFWNNVDEKELIPVKQFIYSQKAEVADLLETKLGDYKDQYYVTEDDILTTVDEAVYTPGAYDLAFGGDMANRTLDAFSSAVEDLDITPEEKSAIRAYLNTPITDRVEMQKGGYKNVVRNGWQKQKLEGILESDMFASLSETGKEAVKSNLTLDSEVAEIMVGKVVDDAVARRRSILLEDLISGEFKDRANYVRGVIDEETSPFNIAEKETAYKERENQIDSTLAKNIESMSNDIQTYLQKIQEEGFGYHPEGDFKDPDNPTEQEVRDSISNGTYRIVVDAPEGKEGEAKDYTDTLSGMFSNFDTFKDQASAAYTQHAREYLEWAHSNEEDMQDLFTVSNELDPTDVRRKDFFGAMEDTYYGTTALFGSETGLKGLKRSEAEKEAYRTMLTFDEAYDTGVKSEYASRTFAQQLPYLMVAMTMSPAAGSGFRALGIGAKTSGLLGQAVTGYGVFGTGSGGQKRTEVYSMREAANRAQEAMPSLERAYKDGKITEAQYKKQKADLEKTIELGKISDDQMYAAMMTSFTIEGTVTTLFGTVPNSRRFLKLFGGQADDMVRLSTHSFVENLGHSTYRIGKETLGEVIEEGSIWFGEQVSGNLILGKDADWSGWKDVVAASIISAGPMQTTANAYGAITGSVKTRGDYAKYLDVQNSLKNIDAKLQEATTDAERKIYRDDYLNKVNQLTNLQQTLEMDALVAGPDGLRDIIQANQQLSRAYSEAGITSRDSEAQIEKKLDKHRAKLSGTKLRAFNSRVADAETAVSGVKAKIAKAHEDGTSIEQVYGQRGLDVAEKLSQKEGWNDLSNRDKATAVHQQIMAEDKKTRIKEARDNEEFMEGVERQVYDGMTFEEYKKKTGKKNRKRALEDDYINFVIKNSRIRNKYAATSAQEGMSIESVLSDPDIAGKFKYIQVEDKQGIIEELKQEHEAGNITTSEYHELVDTLEELDDRTSGTHGAFVAGKYITVASRENIDEAIEDGEFVAGTVVMHEVSHAIDTLTGMDGEGQHENFSDNLSQGLKQVGLSWIDQGVNEELRQLGYKKGTKTYHNEYTKRVQDMLANDFYSVQLNTVRRAGGKGGIKNWFKMARGKGSFNIDSPKAALNFMASNIDALKKGEISKQTKSLIQQPLSRDFDGAETRKSASPRNRKASADIQTIFENEYQNESNADIKEAAENKIIQSMAIPISNMARKVGDFNLPGFDQEILESEITSNKTRGALALVRDYDPRSAKYTLKDGSIVNALVSKKGGLTINGVEVAMSEDYFKDVSNPTQGEIDTFITDQYGAIDTRDQVPVAGYVFQQLNRRMPEFIRKAGIGTEKGFEQNIDDLLGLGIEEDFSEQIDTAPERVGGTIFLADRLGSPDENGVTPGQKISNKIMDLYNAGEIDAEGKTYKTLGVHPEIANMIMEMMGIEPKPGNLSKPDIFNAQRFIDKHVQQVRNAMPLQHTSKVVMTPVIEAGKKKIDEDGKVVMQETLRPDKATGIPKVLLEGMFDKGTRKDNLTPWFPKDMLDSDVKAVFGITERKEQNLYKKDTNTSARIRGMVKIFGLALTNQAIKVAKIQAGDGTAFTFEDGKNQTLFSKTARELINTTDSLGLGILSMTQDPSSWGVFDVAAGNVKSAMRGIFQEKDKIELLREEFGDEAFDKDGNIKKGKLNWLNRKLDKIADELQVIIDPYIKAEESDFEFVMDDRPIQEIIMGHIVNDITTHRQYYKTIAKTRTGETSIGIDLSDKVELDLFHGNITGPLAKFLGPERAKKFLFPAYSAAAKIGKGELTYKNGEIVKNLNYDSSKKNTDRKGVVANVAHANDVLGTNGITLDKKNSTPTIAHSAGKGGWTFKRVKDAVKQRVEINRAQREANQAFRDIADWLKIEYEAGNISVDQIITLLETFNANPKSLTRMAAIFDFAPTRSFDGVATLEHMTPALDINLKALDYILSGNETQAGVDFNDAMDNYRTAFLPEKYDDMVNEYYKSTVPYWQTPDMSPLGRYYGPELFVSGFDLELDMLSTGITIGGKAGIDASTWKAASNGRKKALGNIGKGADKATVEKTRRDAKKASKAKSLYSKSGKRRGMSAWDFDDTLATTKSDVLFTAPDGTKGKLNAEEFAKRGGELLAKGYEFDFSEFNKVTGGKPGPMFDKAMERARKYGTEDTYILTARAPESAPAIKEFLDSLGLNIPLENITGLGNSTGEAKARWLLDKHAEGYNDIAFVDDAMQNVKAVQDVFNEFDIKGKVEQAKVLFSRSAPKKMSAILEGGAKDLNDDFNIILKESKDVGKEKTFSAAKAKQRGKNKSKFKFFLPPSAEDLKGLIYPFLGKGKVGEQHHKWFKENLFDPYSKGMRRLNSIKQEVSADIKALKLNNKDATNKLKKKAPGTDFTYEQAIRVYNWDKMGLRPSGLSKSDLDKLLKVVNEDASIKAFAQGLAQVQDKPGAEINVKEDWLAGTITSDMVELIDQSRDVILQEFNDNADVIFSESNLNKIEAVFGSRHREAVEDMIYRMKTGSTRNFGSNRLMNNFTQWINGSVGTTMFFNSRSAILQMISNINFINWHDNNPLAASKAFANQKQYWTDVAMIFNSPFLKQRRGGIGTDLNAAELLKDLEKSDNKFKTAISYLLQLGFTPTQAADSLAIATGGATMYRNRIKTYLDQGMTQAEAETKAFEDMMEIAEETQQSTRPDKISQQQASPLGKLILAFQNTPMQYNRIMKRAAQDLVNGRGDAREHISKVIYYGGVQSMIFYALQTALFSSMFGDDEDEDKKKERVVNGMIDSILRGAGFGGAVVATLKNTILEHFEQKAKEDDDVYFTEYNEADVLVEALNLSPPIGIKARKLVGGMRTWEFNQDVIDHMSKTDIDNPIYDASFSATEAITNVPLSRFHSKFENLREAADSDNETWKRIAMFLGWNKWSFGIKNQDVVNAKGEIKAIKDVEKEEKKEQKKREKEIQKTEEERQVVEDNKLDQDEKREEGDKEVQCAAVSGSGKRCSNTALPGKDFCTVHDEVPQQEKEVQCSHVKDDGKRCKMKTKNKSGKCYYHD